MAYWLKRYRRTITQVVLFAYVLNPLLGIAQVVTRLGLMDAGLLAQAQFGFGLGDMTTTQSLNLKADNINIQGVGQSSDVTLVAANIDAANKAKIAGTGDVTIASGENRTTHEWTTTNKDCNWYGKCTTTVTHGLEDKTTQVGSDVKGATVEIIQTRAATTQLQSEGDILSQSGGDTKLQGTQVKAQNFTVNAGVGPKADPNAKIIIEGVKETLQTSHTEKSESVVWQAQSGNGVTEETLKLAQINAKTKFSAPGGIDVQLPAGDPLKTQVQTLSKQPGMEWLSDLSQRKDVNWQQIKLAKDQWDYSAQGLTPAGAAILAIVIAVVTAGAATSAAASIATEAGMTAAAGTAGASTAAAAGAGVAGSGVAAGTMLTTTGAALSSAMAAGMTTLASSTAVSFVNNGGDIGKTLKDVGSSQNVKGVLTAMVTAGVLTELGSTTTATGQTGANAQAISTTQAVDKFAANLMQNVTNNMASAVVSSAINGTPLNEDTLSTALTSALITAGMAQTANNIGAATQNGTLNAYTQAMAHALAGCVGGAATTGNSGGCSAGAMGAVVGELTATYALSQNMSDAATVNFAKTMSAVAGAMVGGPDSAAAVNVAAQMGANAAANNRLLHKNEKQVISQMASGDSAKHDRLTDAACAMVKCSAQYAPSTQEYFDAKASEIRGANNTQELVELAKVNQATGLFGYSGIDNANDKFKFTANVVNKEIVQPIKDAKLPDGSYGVGYYQGLGGEVEVEVQNGSVVAGKVGLGVGAGGHINLGTQAVSGALMQGAVLGGKGEALVETNPIQSGEARVGASVGGALGIGAAGIEIGYGAGASGTNQGAGGYQNFTVTPTIAPTIPKIAAEVKANVVEFNVKPDSGNSK